MKIKRVIAAVLSLILSGLPVATYAEEAQQKKYYASFSGKVLEVREYYENDVAVEGKYYVLVENEEGGLMNFFINEETGFLTDNEALVGGNFIGFYDATAPMLMIYPPQVVAVAVAPDLDEGDSVKADLFDDTLTSSDNELKLNVSDETIIVDRNGNKYEGAIENKMLAVRYGASTRSIPAQTSPDLVIVLGDKPDTEIGEITEPIYHIFKGTVIETLSANEEGGQYLNVENEEGEEISFLTDDYTYFMFDGDSDSVEAGDSLICYYTLDGEQPVAAVVVTNLNEGLSVKVDIFDSNAVSADGMLKLNMSDDVEIVCQDGNMFEGDQEDLFGRRLAVIYGASTRSIPAQTTPDKIVVLFEKVSIPVYELPQTEIDPSLVPGMNIYVEGNVIDSPPAFADDNGNLMLALRPVAEALGFTVEWIEETNSVLVDEVVYVSIGDMFCKVGELVFALDAAPVLEDGRTYVPASLFTVYLQSEININSTDNRIEIK